MCTFGSTVKTGSWLALGNAWIHAWLGKEFGNQWDIMLKQIGNEKVNHKKDEG